MKIRVNTGLRIYPIEDVNGEEIGCIRMNPVDMGLINRYLEAKETYEHLQETLPDEIANDEEKIIAFVNNAIIEIFDKLLNIDSKKEIFRYCYPLTPTGNLDSDGSPETYAGQVLMQIWEIISAESEKKRAEMVEKKRKYTEKYSKE